MPLRARCILASKPLHFRSRVDKVAAQTTLDRAVAHKASLTSNILNEKLKDLALVKLEQTVNTT